MQGEKGRRLVVLDGLRGIAAICVMLYHLGNFFGFGGPFMAGYLFVDFFFLLSGFVLALSIEPRFAHGWSTAGFMRARVVRLWPVIAVGALAGAMSYGIRGGWEDVPVYTALALLMLPLAMPGAAAREIFPLNPPQWSLLFEVLANLMHGLVLRRLRDGALLAVALAFAVPLVWFSMRHGNNSLGPDTKDWYLGLPRVGFAYTLGVWMGRRHAREPRKARVKLPVALMLPLLAMVVASVLRTNSWIIDSVVVLVAFPGAIWLASATPPGRAAPLLELLGSLSFPIYAVHLPIVTVFAFVSNSLLSAVAAVLASLIASWLLAVLLERRHLRKPRTAAAPVTPAEA